MKGVPAVAWKQRQTTPTGRRKYVESRVTRTLGATPGRFLLRLPLWSNLTQSGKPDAVKVACPVLDWRWGRRLPHRPYALPARLCSWCNNSTQGQRRSCSSCRVQGSAPAKIRLRPPRGSCWRRRAIAVRWSWRDRAGTVGIRRGAPIILWPALTALANCFVFPPRYVLAPLRLTVESYTPSRCS